MEAIDLLVKNLEIAGLVCFLSAFAVSVGISGTKPEALVLHFSRALGASAIPYGICLIIAGFNPSIISKMDGAKIPIAVGGLSLLYVGWVAMTAKKV
jgi:hypothetical protein